MSDDLILMIPNMSLEKFREAVKQMGNISKVAGNAMKAFSNVAQGVSSSFSKYYQELESTVAPYLSGNSLRVYVEDVPFVPGTGDKEIAEIKNRYLLLLYYSVKEDQFWIPFIEDLKDPIVQRLYCHCIEDVFDKIMERRTCQHLAKARSYWESIKRIVVEELDFGLWMFHGYGVSDRFDHLVNQILELVKKSNIHNSESVTLRVMLGHLGYPSGHRVVLREYDKFLIVNDEQNVHLADRVICSFNNEGLNYLAHAKNPEAKAAQRKAFRDIVIDFYWKPFCDVIEYVCKEGGYYDTIESFRKDSEELLFEGD